MFLLIFNFFILWSLKIFHFQGIFFIIPCVDSYTKVRVHLESVPVKWEKSSFAKHRILLFLFFAGGYEGAHIRCSSTRGQICFSFAKKEREDGAHMKIKSNDWRQDWNIVEDLSQSALLTKIIFQKREDWEWQNPNSWQCCFLSCTLKALLARSRY